MPRVRIGLYGRSVDDLPPPTDDHAIRLGDFAAYYGEYRVLNRITLDVPARRVTALIGPSGCGKSTLLRWFNRLNDEVKGSHARGRLEVLGMDALARDVDVVALRRRVGMVFQTPNPFPKSIYDNVAFGPKLAERLAKSDVDELVEQALHHAALWEEVKDRLHEPALSLSGGQQQRLCIARAIATGPEILLMDEPCSSLDPKSTTAIEELIARLAEHYTIVIVTHNMQQAARASDHCAFLFQGELVEFAPTVKMFSNPARKETEDYITGRFG